jgi:hypothetical protein
MDGKYKSGDVFEKAEEFIVFSGSIPGYTIDYISDEDCHFEKIVVWGDEALRNLIVDLLNKHFDK